MERRAMNMVFTSLIQYRSISLMVVSIVTLSACTQTPEKQSTDAPQARGIDNISVSAGDREKYKEGLIALNNNNNDKAESIFNDLLEDKPELAGHYTNLA